MSESAPEGHTGSFVENSRLSFEVEGHRPEGGFSAIAAGWSNSRCVPLVRMVVVVKSRRCIYEIST